MIAAQKVFCQFTMLVNYTAALSFSQSTLQQYYTCQKLNILLCSIPSEGASSMQFTLFYFLLFCFVDEVSEDNAFVVIENKVEKGEDDEKVVEADEKPPVIEKQIEMNGVDDTSEK